MQRWENNVPEGGKIIYVKGKREVATCFEFITGTHQGLGLGVFVGGLLVSV